jgi:hypothetical protein
MSGRVVQLRHLVESPREDLAVRHQDRGCSTLRPDSARCGWAGRLREKVSWW